MKHKKSIYWLVCKSNPYEFFHLFPLHLLLKSGWYLHRYEHWSFIPVQMVVSLGENKPDSSRMAPARWLAIAQGNGGRVGGQVTCLNLQGKPLRSHSLSKCSSDLFWGTWFLPLSSSGIKADELPQKWMNHMPCDLTGVEARGSGWKPRGTRLPLSRTPCPRGPGPMSNP